jgi:3-phenylpropionate/trans-cinnamate dioxygenase ferredoxin reductase component
MMRRDRHVAVIGGGQAAARSIAAMRDAGFDGTVTLIGEESELPYERPPLSKEALFGAPALAPATIFKDAFYAERGVDLCLGRRVIAIDATTGAIDFEKGADLKADRILLATGARPRDLALPGVETGRISYLRNFADATRLRPLLEPPCRLVLVGGGFIGLEIAAGAAKRGCQVTVIEALPRLMQRAVSARVSEFVQDLHRAQGVSIKTGCTVTGARQGSSETELLLSDNTLCIADVIIAGIGAIPNVELAENAGIACNNGIEIAGDGRTSSDIVWAAGDVASRVHSFCGTRMRLESWENAEIQGGRAGRSIAASWSNNATPGPDADSPPWFWTDQYDMNLQILGASGNADHFVVRGDKSGKGEIIFHFRGDRLCGAELISAGRERPIIKRLMQSGYSLPPEKLGDINIPLKELWNATQAMSQSPEKESTLGLA